MPSVLPRRALPWIGVAGAALLVACVSVFGLRIAHRAGDAGLGLLVTSGVPLLLGLAVWRAPRFYERHGVAWAVAKPWVVIGLAAEGAVLFLGQHGIERIHVLTFGLLGAALAHALVLTYGLVWGGALVALLGAALGLADEVLQGFLRDRVYDPRDVLMNLLAVLAVLAFARPFSGWPPRPSHPVPRSVWGAALVLAATMALVLVLGSRPSVSAEQLVGVWDGTNGCGVSETLDIRPGGHLEWQDAEGNQAQATWSITSSAFESALGISPTRVRNRRKDCGLQPGRTERAPVLVKRGILTIPLREPLRYVRRAEAPPS